MGSSFLRTTRAKKGNNSMPTLTSLWPFIGSNLIDRFALAGKRKRPRGKNRKPTFIRVLWAVSCAPGRDDGTLRRQTHSAAAALGRLSSETGYDRILAGSPESPARSLSLHSP